MIIGTYIAILLASFFGIIIGIILSNMAVEEITHAAKYLKYINIIFPTAILFLATYKLNQIYSIIFTIILFAILILFRKKNNNAWIYSCMGALLYVAIMSEETLNVAILIFVYGIMISTVNISKYFKNKNIKHISHTENLMFVKNALKDYSYYLVIGILFFSVFTYIL